MSAVGRLRTVAILTLVPLLGSCREMPPAAPAALATTKAGPLTAGDLDAYVLSLPAVRRRSLGRGDEAVAALLREMVVRRALLDAARGSDLPSSDEAKEASFELTRDALAEACMEKLAPGTIPAVTDEDARRYYEENRARFLRPARRLVFTIFLREDPGDSRDELKARAAALRDRIVAGEPFADVARAESDSETRSEGGLVGWLTEGESPGDLDRIIFGLPLGTPSQPVGTRDGYHLFMVKSANESKQFSLDEVRRNVVQELVGARQAELIDRLTAGTPLPEGSFVPTEEELREIVAAGDRSAAVLRIGAYELPLSRLASLVAGREPQGGRPIQLIQGIARRERLCHHCEAKELVPAQDVEARSARRRDEILEGLARREKLRGWIAEHPTEIEGFFARNERRFMTPLRLKLRVLACPPDRCNPAGSGPDDGAPGREVALMGILEREAGALSTGAKTLEEVATALGATTEELAPLTLPQIKRRDPRAAAILTTLLPGQVTPPLSHQRTIELIQLAERLEPHPRPLVEVREQVEAAYLEAHQQDVYAEVEARLLEELGFQLHPERFHELGPPWYDATAGSPAPDAPTPVLPR